MGTLDTSADADLAVLETTVATDPEDVGTRLKLIEQLANAGRTVEALVHAQTIISARPDDPHGYRAAARCCGALRDARERAFARVADALEQYHEEAHADVWRDFVPPGSAEAAAEQRDAAAATTPADAPDGVDDRAADDDAPAPFAITADDFEHPQLTFKNVIGVELLKRRIEHVVLGPIRTAPARQIGGYLMFGPPGCGKGFFARAIAGELGAAFLPVEMANTLSWRGDLRDNIHRVFNAARDAAPCVLFLNDLELAGRDPEVPTAPPDRRVLTRIAAELANTAANARITILGGTTAPWDVDVALRTAGALDHALLVPPPDARAREAILRHQFQTIPLAGLDVAWIVDRTQHFSGNDLLALCTRAHHLAVNDASIGTPTVGPGHMTRALREVRPTAPTWFSVALEHAINANHGGMYDAAVAYVEENNLI